MTRNEFASLRIGQRIFVVESPVINGQLVEPAKMIRKARVTELQRHYAWHPDGEAVTTGETIRRRHHRIERCFITRAGAVCDAVRRIDLASAELQRLRDAIVAKLPPEGGGA